MCPPCQHPEGQLARYSGACGAIAGGFILQSFGVEPGPALTTATAAAAGAAVGVGVFQNLAANSIAAVCSRLVAGEGDDHINHDLAKLFIDSVAETLRRIANPARPNPVERDLTTRLLAIADALPARWLSAHAAGKAGHAPRFNEQKFVDLFRFGHTAGSDAPPVGEADDWGAFIHEHAPWDKACELSDADLATVGGLVRDNFAAAARDQVRTDFTELRRSYPALVIRLLSEVAQAQERYARESKTDHAQTREVVRRTGRVLILAQARAEAILQRLDERLAGALAPGIADLAGLESRFWGGLDELLGAVHQEGKAGREHTTSELERFKSDIIAGVLAASKTAITASEQPRSRSAELGAAAGATLELAVAANIVRKYDTDRLDRARAAVAARDFASADEQIAELKRSDAYTHAIALKLVEGRRWFEAGEFKAAEPCFRAAVLLDGRHAESRVWLGLSLSQIRDAAPRPRLREAMLHYEEALKAYTREAAPMDWAMTQNNLGNAWNEYPDEDRRAALDRAIGCFEAALTVYTREAAPTDWAMTQNNLGNAWNEYPDEDPRAALDRAIGCYEAALTVRTREAAPMDWAMTQNNLGNAWRQYPDEDRRAALDRAIGCYEAALTGYTREASPMDWAMIQNNLGNAWNEYPDEDRRPALDRAIGCYEAVLTVYTREAAPVQWATTQNNLGVAWNDYPDEDRRPALDRAIGCFEVALTVRTREAAPMQWAMTQNNLGNALSQYPDEDTRAALDRAVGCYEAALIVYTLERFPWHHGVVSRNLEHARARRDAL